MQSNVAEEHTPTFDELPDAEGHLPTADELKDMLLYLVFDEEEEGNTITDVCFTYVPMRPHMWDRYEERNLG